MKILQKIIFIKKDMKIISRILYTILAILATYMFYFEYTLFKDIHNYNRWKQLPEQKQLIKSKDSIFARKTMEENRIDSVGTILHKKYETSK